MKLYVAAFFIILNMGCHTSGHITDKPLRKSFDYQGHRGCRGLMPENTITGMLKAIDLGVTTLEMDVVITKDSQVILSHEPFFGHEISTLPNGDTITPEAEKGFNIFQMSYARVQQIDVGLKPHPRFPVQQKMAAYKPRLEDLIDSVEQYIKDRQLSAVYYNIETKTSPDGDHVFHPAPDIFVTLLMQVIIKKNIAERVIIQSFDIRTLQYLHQQYPQIKTALLIEAPATNNFAAQLKALGFIPAIYSPEFTLATPLLITQCHQMGMQIIPWTVNSSDEIKRLKKMGVDGIISDYPDLFQINKKR